MMSFKEFKASVNTTKVAGPPQQPTTSKHLTNIAKETPKIVSPTPSTSSTMSSTFQEPSNMKMGKLFTFIDDAYRDIRRLHSGFRKDSYNNHLMQTINKYKNGCNRIFEEVLESHEMSKKLAQNIVRTIDIFKELCTSLTDLEEYQHRVCEMMAIFIACELRLSVDTTTQEQLLIGQRIVYIMRRHLVQEIEEDTRYNILRTLVYIPRLFNARDIMCAIFGQFIPMKPVVDVNVLSDRLYMLYIIVFYRWMMMQKDDDDKLLIVNFAESFMKPSVTLCTNQLYAKHLPRYTTHSTATRTILNNMKFYRDIRNASIIDNALKKIGPIVDLCDDDEDADLIILDTSNSTEFAEIFSSVQLESLDNSMTHIKLEEKTIIGTVDLTLEEEESTNSPKSICEIHDKWLNNFQQLAKQYRESQIIIERKQNSQQISNNQKDVIISLDSDSESDEDISTTTSNVKQSMSTTIENNENSNSLVEELFVDNYPPTVTPINCGTDLESSDVEDDDDVTKLSSRFLSGTIRTYQVKKVNQLESQNNNDKAYRRDSIHISSTPPENPDEQYSDNQEDDGTDVQDEHDQDEEETNSLSSITLETPRPRGPYPTYDRIQTNKIVFSQSPTRLAYDKEQRAQRLQEWEQQHPQIQQYHSDGSEIKTNKKQKKRVHFNTSPIGPTDVANPAQHKPLKPVLQQSTYKASYAPDHFQLRGYERLMTTAPSTTGSASTCGSVSTTLSLNKQDHQEHTNENCNNKNNEDKRDFKQTSIKVNHNKKCLKNLSVFNQKYLFKHKSFKNVKINLKRLKLNSDISLTNSNSNCSKEKEVEQPPPLLPHTSLTLLNDNTTHLNHKQTETCQLKTNSTDNSMNNNIQVNDDDVIFKKPLPVTKKIVKSPKPFKIHKVVSLRAQSFYLKTKNSTQTEKGGSSIKGNDHIWKTPIVTDVQEIQGEIKAEPASGKQLSLNFQNKNNACNVPNSNVAEMDDLSKISKLLTEEINNLTSEHNNLNSNTVNGKNDIENITQEREKNEREIENGIEVTDKVGKGRETSENSTITSTNDNIEGKKSDTLNGEEFNEINLENELSTNGTEIASSDYCKNPLKGDEILECINDNKKFEKELNSYAKCHQETYEKNTENGENVVEDSEKIFENKLLEISNEDTLKDNDVSEELKTTYDSTNTKDCIISTTSYGTENSSQAITDFSKNEDVGDDILKDEDILNTENKTDDSHNLVTQFCAEFLAGLPNEPSSEIPNVNNTNSDARNDIDFEFENHCPTPTMCRFDLDTMTENTSELPNTMPLTQLSIEDCEADKLLEDFNHKTEDIVDSTLSKNSKTSDLIISNNEQNTQEEKTLYTVSNETTKRSLEDKDIIGIENTGKRYISELLNDESENNEKDSENVEISSKTKYNTEEISSCSNISNENLQEKDESRNNMIATDCNQTKSLLPRRETNKVSRGGNSAMTDIILEDNQTKVILSPNFSTANNYDYLNKEEIPINTDTKEREIRKSLRSYKTKHNQENYHKTPMKKLKKSNKHANEGKIKSPTRENSEDLMKTRSVDIMDSSICSNPAEKLEDKKLFKQKEKSINENQHMTLELANWKQDMQNENKPKNSESAGGVSAIFSFPKIPIISISICTTPNNKTYFKISNRENDDNTSKEAEKIKQNNENMTETKNDDTKVKTAPEDLCRKDNFTYLDKDEEKKIEKDKVICENNIEEENEDFEEEGEEEETDNIEIEKFSHDSNSACSLPLKKRPTQSEPNGETENSEQIVATNLEQPQEIAAEVVIENFEKLKNTNEENSSSEIEQIMLEKEDEHNENNAENSKHQTTEVKHIENSIMLNNLEDNKPSTSAASLKKLNDPSAPFKRRGKNSMRSIGQPPVQIVAPQLKDKSPSPLQEHRAPEIQVPNAQRILTQNTQQLLESYPATPMLSVANVEKLMDFNRFIEDLLASPDVMTIIDNANACGYYAEGQAFEMERIAILEHYNIANAKGNTSVTKPLYWKKSAGDTISIFNDNDNEWIALPPSTAKQLLKLSFVLSILQQQYKVSDVRQRINIALTFLIQTSYTSKLKPNTNTSSLQQCMQVLSRKVSDCNNSSSHNMPSTSYFRIATNNDAQNTNFSMNSNIDASQDLPATNCTNTHQHQESEDPAIQQELSTTLSNSSQNWNNLMQIGNTNSGNGVEIIATTTNTVHHITTNMENDQQQQHVQQDKHSSSWDELNNDQLYINPPCATSPQNEVIVNTNGVQLHEMPQNCQDQQNIFISITDESGPTVGNNNPTEPVHKYNTRQQQQQQHRALDDLEQITTSSSLSPTSQSFGNRQFLGNGSGSSSIIQNNIMNNSRNSVISIFGNQEINLQNPYRTQQNIQQQQQQQQQSQPPQIQINQLLNVTSPHTSNQQQGNISSSNNISQNLSININNNIRALNPLQQQQTPQHRMCTRYSATNFNSQQQQQQQQQTILQNNQNKTRESNYKEILQPYITYLIKDHEKTSKHLLQVFEEVSNSNFPSTSSNINVNNRNNFTVQEQQYNTMLPTLIRNPQQNHMPGFHRMPGERNFNNVLPSLIRNPNQTLNITNRDSGALQVVQSFIDQTQPNNLNSNEQLEEQQQQQDSPQTSTFINPGFAKEYVNFIGSRDEVLQKQKLRNFRREEQRHEQFLQETERLNSVKRECKERNDKLAEDLKCKIMEFSRLKHNVQIKLSEKQQRQQQEQNNITGGVMQSRKRGRPRKSLVSTAICNEISAADFQNNCNDEPSSSIKNKPQRQTKTSNRTKRKQINSEQPSGIYATDHAYFRQRTAAREAVKRINAAVNNSFQ